MTLPLRRILLPFLALCAAALAVPSAASAADVIVRFAPGADAGERAEARDDAGVIKVESIPIARAEVVTPEAGTSIAEAVAELERSPDVALAEPDAPRRGFLTSNDERVSRQWGLANTAQQFWTGDRWFSGTADADIDAPEAWDVTADSSAITVGVIDSGVDPNHPDLVANLAPGGWDFVDRDAAPHDTNGHGTHVSGIIGAEGNNLIGVSGVAWQASLMPLRVLGTDGTGSTSDVISAIVYAAEKRVRIANLSLGGDEPSDFERSALQAASDTLFVVAAGNEADDNDAAPRYPCAYDLPNVLCVAASDENDELAGFSNYGATTVDVAAPGVEILSTWPGNRYAWDSGTSMATPMVAGAAALVLAQRPELTPWQLGRVLMDSADRLPALAGTTVSGGRLNVAGALDRQAPDATLEPPARIPATVLETLPPVTPTPAPTPIPTPTPAPSTATPVSPGAGARPVVVDRSAPSVGLSLAGRGALRSALAGRLRVRSSCSERCTIRVQLLVDRRTARALRLGSGKAAVRIATGTATLKRAGRSSVAVRLTTKAGRALRARRSVKVTMRATAADTAGNRRTRSRTVTLRR